MYQKIPLVFQNVVRKRYFEIFKIFTEDAGLILDIGNYKDDVLIDRNCKIGPGIVAIIESHSAWGADDLANERKKRKYDGLKIAVSNDNYRMIIKQIADKIKRNLQEDVIVK